MKRPLIFQNAKMDSWHLIDWVETLSVCCVKHIGRRRRRTEASSMFTPMECEVLWASGGGSFVSRESRILWREPRDSLDGISAVWSREEFRVQSSEFRACSWWSCTSGWAPQSEQAGKSGDPGWQGRMSARRGRCIALEQICHVEGKNKFCYSSNILFAQVCGLFCCCDFFFESIQNTFKNINITI